MNTQLVKQAQTMLNESGMNATLEETYHELLKQNLINIDGSPTKWALDNGLIGEIYSYDFPHGLKKPEMAEAEKEDHDLNEVFSRMPKSSFMENKKDDDYFIDVHELAKAIKEALADGSLTPDGRKKWRGVLNDLKKQISD